jgi:(E)-4-hydroxy-3-methylbut-2-enyl-diphosphate synthase
LGETGEFKGSKTKITPTENINFIQVDTASANQEMFSFLSTLKNAVLVVHTTNEHAMPSIRQFFLDCLASGVQLPIIIQRSYSEKDKETFLLHASTDTGALFIDGFGDGLWLSHPAIDAKVINAVAFGVLQASRTRISKTEYISCPSCGRTLFDLQETTARIRAVTDHLKGVKIGIMGCIVNGPGEMADANFGYVGTGPGKITLYKGKEVVKRNIDATIAVDELINLIKKNNMWVDKAHA